MSVGLAHPLHDNTEPLNPIDSMRISDMFAVGDSDEPTTQVVERRSQFPSLSPPRCMRGVVGRSEGLTDVYRVIDRVADTNCTVLITGESGTGKELVARAVHDASQRSDAPFVAVNCGAIPESLLESELFGHAKGAFTGAHAARQGRIGLAQGGTLFLDEIGELPLALQVKLLRVLQSREYSPVGDTRVLRADVRIVAATNIDLEQAARTGTFREDLYYRLNVIPLELPPLAQRTEDIEHLIMHFLAMMEETYTIKAPNFSKQALKVLKDYSWPGNIRELRNLCERLSILLAGRTIEPENLPREFVIQNSTPKAGAFTLPETGVQLDSLEADLIHQALSRTKGNRSKSAKLLGLSRDTLLYRMQKYGFTTS